MILDIFENLFDSFNPFRVARFAKENYENYRLLIKEIQSAIGLRNQISRFLQLDNITDLCSIPSLQKQTDDLDTFLKKMLEGSNNILDELNKNQELLNKTIELYNQGENIFSIKSMYRSAKIRHSPKYYRDNLTYIINEIGKTLNQIYLEQQFLRDQPCLIPTKIPIKIKPPPKEVKMRRQFDELYK